MACTTAAASVRPLCTRTGTCGQRRRSRCSTMKPSLARSKNRSSRTTAGAASGKSACSAARLGAQFTLNASSRASCRLCA